MPGHHRDVGAARGPAASSSTSDVDAAFAAAFSDEPLSPAILAEDGRGPVTILNEVRDRASQVASGLEQLGTAGARLSRVQKLVRRLRDVAVVALDRGLQPADRAALQRQVDLVLAEIDAVAEEATLEDGLLRDGAAAGNAGGGSGAQASPFRAIGTGALGIAGLAVRSSDQALAATGALDVATARLEHSAGTLSSATARLQDELDELTGPETTSTGQPAIGGVTAALSSTMLLRAQFEAYPDQAIQAQSGLDVSRVRWLLDTSPR